MIHITGYDRIPPPLNIGAKDIPADATVTAVNQLTIEIADPKHPCDRYDFIFGFNHDPTDSDDWMNIQNYQHQETRYWCHDGVNFSISQGEIERVLDEHKVKVLDVLLATIENQKLINWIHPSLSPEVKGTTLSIGEKKPIKLVSF
jgi:hypothetical protein